MSATSRGRRSDALYHATDMGRRVLCDKIALLEDELHESQEEMYGLHCAIAKEETSNAKLLKELEAEHALAETLGHYHELEQAENAKLRERIDAAHMSRLLTENENESLRELVGLWSVINKHMSLCATTDCGQCPVREECEESVYLEGLLGIDSKGLSWRVQERMLEVDE